jgi:hypothetical protein
LVDGFTPEVKRLAVKLAAILPYALTTAVLDELAQIQISDSRVWKIVQVAGAMADHQLIQQAEAANAMPNPDEISRGITPTPTCLAATMDGALLNIRGEGWKEAKIGCIFAVHPRPKVKPEDRDRVRAKHISYRFHLGPPEPFGRQLWALAQQRGWLSASTTAVVGDGAAWIWNLAERHFPTSTHIVDWYHAKQHLWTAAHAIAPDVDASSAWVNRMESALFAGQTRFISSTLTSAATQSTGSSSDLLRREAAYFADNTTRMQYHTFAQRHLPLGSGTVESAAKQFKDRFTQAGMRWSRQGAVNLFPFRAAVLSHSFDALWRSVCP